jgi:hypothetical protein
MRMSFVGFANALKVIPLRREDTLRCALIAFENFVLQSWGLERTVWNPSGVVQESKGFQKSCYRGQGGVYVYADALSPLSNGQDADTREVPNQYSIIRVVGKALPDTKCNEGLYNRFRQRESKGEPWSWRWIHVVPIERDHAFLIRKLELYLLDRFRTTDNINDCRDLRNAFGDGCVFDDLSDSMQPEEFEKRRQWCDRSSHIYWFQNGKWP